MIDSTAVSRTPSPIRPQRGRPVGSGIDDRARLDAVRAYIASHPGTKPTTAIRALGHTDPSVIRRLREKLKSGVVSPGPRSKSSSRQAARTCAARWDSERAFRIKEEAARAKRSEPSIMRTPAADPLLTSLLGLAINACATALTMQQAVFETMLQSPLVRAALHQQIAVNEMALSLLRVPASPSRHA